MSDLKIQGVVEMSAENAERVLDNLGNKAGQMATKTERAAQQAGAAVDGIGSGANGAADKLTRAESRMVESIKRVQTQMDLAGKTASQKFEFNIAAKGLDASKFEPMLAKMREAEAAQSRLSSGSVELSGKLAALSVGALASVAAFKAVASSMIDAQQQSQKLKNSLEYAAGGASGAVREIEYLREVTQRLGLDFSTSSQAYAKFAAATRDSGISLSQTKTVFEGIAQASARLGLSADETQGALLALSQMASKGTVSAEELRGQLGERLPGAFNIAAKAMGVTTAELGKMLETGQIMASDFLPKFGQALKDNFQAPLESLTQEINRFSSAWTLWKQEVSEGTNGGGFKWLTNGLNESTAAMRALGKEAGFVHKMLVAIGGFEAGAIGSNKFDKAKTQEQAMQALPAIRDQRQAMEDKSYLNAFERQTLADLKRQEAAIRKSINDLAEQRGKETGINLPDLAGEYAAQQKKQTDKLNAYLKDVSNAPKAAKVASEVEKENESFKVAVSGLAETDARYIAALKSHDARVAEIQARGNASGGRAKKTSGAYDELFSRQEQEKAILKELAKETESIEKANLDYAKSIEALYAPIEKEAESLELQLQNYGMTRAEIEANTLARLEEQRVMLASQEGFDELITNLDREIAARKRIKEAAEGIEAKKAGDEWAKESERAAKKVADDWDKTSDKIGDSITDALMRGFESGKDFAENLRDTVVNMFKTMVLQPTIKGVVVGGLSALGMGSATAADGSGSSSGLGGIGDLASMGNSAMNLFSGSTASAGLYGSFAASGIGQALGLSSTAAFVGPPAAGAAVAEVGLTGLGSALGTAIPVIGAVLAVGGILSSIFGGSGERFKALTSDASGSYADGKYTAGGLEKDWGKYAGKGDLGDDADKAMEQTVKAFSQRVGGLFDAFDLDTQMSAVIGARLRRTSGALRAGLTADVTGEGVQETLAGADYGGDGEIQNALGQFVNDVMTKGIVNAVEKSKLPQVVKDAFAPLTETSEIDAAIGIVASAQERLMASNTSLVEFMGESYADFVRDNETLIGTINRVVTSLFTVNSVLEDINQSAYAITLVGGDAASQLADLTGGLEAFVAKTSAYYESYFSKDEQIAKLTEKVEKAFAGIEIEMPDSKAAFRQILEGLDLTTEAGRESYAVMINLAGSFAKITDEAAAAVKTMSIAANDMASQALSNAESAVENALAGLERAIDAEKTRIESAYAQAKANSEDKLAALRSISDIVKSALNNSGVPNSLAGYTLAQNGLGLAAAQMRNGIMPDADALSQMIGRTSSPDTAWFASQADMQRAQAKTNAALIDLSASTTVAMTVEERTLATLKSQFEKQTAALDAQLATAKAQVDALFGIDNRVRSIAAGVKELSQAMSGYRSAAADKAQADLAKQQLDVLNGIGSGVKTLVESFAALNVAIYNLAKSTGQVAPLPIAATGTPYTSAAGATYTPATDKWDNGKGGSAITAEVKAAMIAVDEQGGSLGVYNAARTHGISLIDVDRIGGLPAGTSEAWAKANNLPVFAKGANFIPEDTLAMVHQGERIIPAADNRALMAELNNGSSGAMLIELKAVRDELAKLRAENSAENRAIAGHTAQTSRNLDRVVDGDALLTRAVA